MTVFWNKLPSRCTRKKRNSHRKKKCIHSAISNKEDVILSLHVKRQWYVSDHLPIEVRFKNKQKSSKRKSRIIFDRSLLLHVRVIKKIAYNEYKLYERASESNAELSQESIELCNI